MADREECLVEAQLRRKLQELGRTLVAEVESEPAPMVVEQRAT